MYRSLNHKKVRISFGKLCTAITFFALANSLTASTLYTYTYSGPDFSVFDNTSTEVPPITSGNVVISLTLNAPIVSNGLLTDYTSDITTWMISDGQVTLDPADSSVDAFFGTTAGAITDWTITATANGLGGDDYYQIDSETNTGILSPGQSPFYSDIALNVDTSGGYNASSHSGTGFNQGEISVTGVNPSPFVASAPEPSTEVMLFLGALPFLTLGIVRKVRGVRKSGRQS
jgi:hypothetical protein